MVSPLDIMIKTGAREAESRLVLHLSQCWDQVTQHKCCFKAFLVSPSPEQGKQRMLPSCSPRVVWDMDCLLLLSRTQV